MLLIISFMNIFIYSFTYHIYVRNLLMAATSDFCMEETYNTMSLGTDIRVNTNYKCVVSCASSASNMEPRDWGLISHITIVHYFS